MMHKLNDKMAFSASFSFSALNMHTTLHSHVIYSVVAHRHRPIFQPMPHQTYIRTALAQIVSNAKMAQNPNGDEERKNKNKEKEIP